MGRADDSEAAIDDEDALYTKLEKLGCRSWKDLKVVLHAIGIDLQPDAPASRAMLRAALDHLKTKRPRGARLKEPPHGEVL